MLESKGGFLSLFLSVLLILTFVIVCAPKSASAAVIVSRIAQNADGKGYLEVDGKPMICDYVQSAGTQMCNGDSAYNGSVTGWATPLPISRLENAHEKCAALNYKIISIILYWKDIEPTSQGTYDWTVINKYVDWANTYNLRIDFAWFGSNGCGGTRLPTYKNGWMCSVPVYLRNKDQYWGLGQHADGQLYPWITGQGHDTDVAFLKTCEINAVTALFNHLATYDTNHRVVLFQLNNETNMHPNWGDYWRNYMNDMGQAIKNSNYVVATRANIMGGSADAGCNSRQYIDYNAPDPYNAGVTAIKNVALNTSATKMTAVAENGPYDNTSSLTVTALVNGGFYSAWELFTEWWIGLYSSNFKDAVVGVPGTMTHGGTDTKNLNGAMNKINSLIAQTSKTHMAGFNVTGDNPSSNCNEQQSVGDYSITYACSDASVGMAVQNGSYVYCVSDTAGSATFKTTQNPASVSAGYMDTNNNWVNQSSRTATNNGDGTYSVTCNSQECIRIEMGAIPINVAFNRSATASSTGAAGQEPDKAVDGTTATKWSSVLGETSWLQVDLGQSYNISGYLVKHAAPYETWGTQSLNTRDFTFQVSTNGTTWITVDTVTGNTANVTDHVVTANGYRYVKLNITNPQTEQYYRGARIYEFEVYGSSGGSTPTPTPTPTSGETLLSQGMTASASSYAWDCIASQGNDGNSTTTWHSALNGTDNPIWWQVDLGTANIMSRFELDFVNDVTYAGERRNFKVEGSNTADFSSGVVLLAQQGSTVVSGAAWSANSSNTTSTFRYIRVSKTVHEAGDPYGTIYWTFKEFRAYGSGSPTPTPTPTPGELSRTGWTATASRSGYGDNPINALDTNTTNRWTTGAPMVNGDYYRVDMSSAKSFNKIVLEEQSGDYLRGYQVFISNDDVYWGSVIASGSGSAVTTITFSSQNARYIKVVQTGSASVNWSIHEFRVYN